MNVWIVLAIAAISAVDTDFDVDAFFDAIAAGEIDPVMADWSGVAAAAIHDEEATQASFRAMMAEVRRPLRALGYEPGDPVPGPGPSYLASRSEPRRRSDC